MADGRSWDDERVYSSSYSDDTDSPLLSYRYEKRRSSSPVPISPARERALPTLTKVSLFCSFMILFCVLMYIPVYNKANYQYQVPKGAVSGWSIETNRDTKIYVKPNNRTTLIEPSNVCQHKEKNKIFLLVIVCSSTTDFERRIAIRETWGKYENYLKAYKLFVEIKERYKNYNYSYDLYPAQGDVDYVNKSNETKRHKRDEMSIKNVLPELAKVLKDNLNKVDIKSSTEAVTEEKRFEDETDSFFDMNSLLTDPDVTETTYSDYDSNIMRIPRKGEESELPDLDKIINQLKESNINIFTDKAKISDEKAKENDVYKLLSQIKGMTDFTNDVSKLSETKDFDHRDTKDSAAAKVTAAKVTIDQTKMLNDLEGDFKLVFLLGKPGSDNDSSIQNRIEEEARVYRDVIQEDFIDSYNNLTLKSIMMLKWVTNRCKDSVRYILKTDDDIYINLPNLVLNLRNRSMVFDWKHGAEKEYMLIGDLITGAKPVQDTRDKWFSPRYMYNGKVYPRYLSGMGYCLSSSAASALYEAALNTNYFHLEDIYITGMCSSRANPPIQPRDDPLFSYRRVSNSAITCCAHDHVTAHRVSAMQMPFIQRKLMQESVVDRCERFRLTQVRKDRMRPKKKKTKPKPSPRK